MYVATFYSFKGGVGRTMSLMNVAVELARCGRRVLIVDFDLEAPGLDTFRIPSPQVPTPGIVEFVGEYVKTGQSPDVSGFIYEVPGVGERSGGLWVMPAGLPSNAYSTTLQEIDWVDLYERKDGFLLLEDLKEQWRRHVDPHYVLVDSRTGYTDVGGICTRQLPDAVLIFFFPNEQNLRGLRNVVSDIRAEHSRPKGREIDIHFIMSNVPDLDDEESILAERIRDFKRGLEFDEFAAVIHRYDSLALLNQVIFTKERPRSRLANEYQTLTRKLISSNPNDRDGALDYLRKLMGPRPRLRRQTSPESIDRRIEEIQLGHGSDGEVLFHIGLLRQQERRFDEAASLFTEALEKQYLDPDVYLARAQARRAVDDVMGAAADAMAVLHFPTTIVGDQEVTPFQVNVAISLLNDGQLSEAALSPAVVALSPSDRIYVASNLDQSRIQLQSARDILTSLLVDRNVTREERDDARVALSLVLIGLGAFEEARDIIATPRPEAISLTMQDAFNYAMAEWADTGTAPADLFDRVVQIDKAKPRSNPTANYFQCLAVASWGTNDVSSAARFAERARTRMAMSGRRDFSCWRYCHVSPEEFLKDMDTIDALIRGESVTPSFFEPSGRRGEDANA